MIVAHEFNKKALDFETGTDAMPLPTLSPRELDGDDLSGQGVQPRAGGG